jgi:hypothetical protein
MFVVGAHVRRLKPAVIDIASLRDGPSGSLPVNLNFKTNKARELGVFVVLGVEKIFCNATLTKCFLPFIPLIFAHLITMLPQKFGNLLFNAVRETLETMAFAEVIPCSIRIGDQEFAHAEADST